MKLSQARPNQPHIHIFHVISFIAFQNQIFTYFMQVCKQIDQGSLVWGKVLRFLY
jgi:hypothetical protein